MGGQRRGGSPRGKKGSRKNEASAAEKKACEEEKAMKDVLRMLAGSPNLPAKFLNVARGMLLLDNPEILQASSSSQAGGRGPGQSRRGSIATDTSTAKGSRQNIGKGVPAEENPAVTGNGRRENAVAPEQGADPDNRNNGRNKEQDEEEKKREAARALEFDRGVLRDWATRRRRSSAMKIAEVGLKALRSKCMKTTADFRNDILAHLRSAKDPSKVCRNLGMVASALIGELEFVGAIAAETESETDTGDHNNDTSSVMTMRSAFGREDGRVDGDGTMVQGDSNVAGSAFGTRGVGGSKQVATAVKPSPPTSTPSPSYNHPVPPIEAMSAKVPGTARPPRPTSDQSTPNSRALDGNCHVSSGVRQEGNPVKGRRESGISPDVVKPEVGQEKRLVGMFSPITVVAGRCRRTTGSGGARDKAQVSADKSRHVNLKRHPQQWPGSQQPCTAGAGGYEGAMTSGRGASTAPISVPGSGPRNYTGNLTPPLRATSSEKATVAEAATTMEGMLASSSSTGVEPGQGRTVPNYHQRQKGAAGVGVNSKELGIGERCNGVRHRLEGVGDSLNHVDGGYSPTAARGLEAGTQANMTAMQEVQDMLKEMNQTPEGYRDLALEDDYFTAIKQLLSWTPPPKWERTRDGHKAQLIAAAGVFLKKALILDGPPGFWPLPLEGQSEDRVQRWKMGAGGVPIFIFRRKESLRKAAGGGARSGGRIRHGVWSFGASGFRYASKPPVPPAGRIP